MCRNTKTIMWFLVGESGCENIIEAGAKWINQLSILFLQKTSTKTVSKYV